MILSKQLPWKTPLSPAHEHDQDALLRQLNHQQRRHNNVLNLMMVLCGLFYGISIGAMEDEHSYVMLDLDEPTQRLMEPRELIERVVQHYAIGAEEPLALSWRGRMEQTLGALPIDDYNAKAALTFGSRALPGQEVQEQSVKALEFLVTELRNLSVQGIKHKNENQEEMQVLHDAVTDLAKVSLAIAKIAQQKQRQQDELEESHADVVKKLSRSRWITVFTAGNAFGALILSNIANYFFSHQ